MKKLFLILAFAFIFMLPLCSAVLNTVDIKDSTALDKVAKTYPAIEINSWLDLPLISEKLLSGQIEKHTESCGDDCISEFELCTYKPDSILIDDIVFETVNKDGTRKVEPIRSSELKLRTEHKLIEVTKYADVCLPSGKELNGTDIISCSKEPYTVE